MTVISSGGYSKADMDKLGIRMHSMKELNELMSCPRDKLIEKLRTDYGCDMLATLLEEAVEVKES